MKAKGCHRRHPYRTLLTIVALIMTVRTVYMAVGSCPSRISCLGWRIAPRFFQSGEEFMHQKKMGEELRRAFMVEREMDLKDVDNGPDSLGDLIVQMGSKFNDPLDIEDFVLKSKAMLMKMELRVQAARRRAIIYRELASVGIPKSVNCLTLKLAEEYSINSLARSSLPPPELSCLLTDPSYLHIVLLSDNVLATAVTVSSTLVSSTNPDKLVFHIVTDKKTYSAMHAWFALHPILPAIVEVKGLHQFDWSTRVNAMITNTVSEISQGALDHHELSNKDDDGYRRLQGLKPSSFSLLSYLRIHLPELFPRLERVILLDDDVIVQRDLTPLWNLDLNGNVNGAVRLVSGHENGDCIEMKFKDYLNFSHAQISSLTNLEFEEDQCSWFGGMNIFDLKTWRRTDITQSYQQWLTLNRESGFLLMQLGWLPPALIAFDGYVHTIDPQWHLTGLGRRMPDPEYLESAAVLHFSGPRKPWLEIGFPELREIWQAHINRSNKFIRGCAILE